MKYIIPIALSVVLATAADTALYAFANRERPTSPWGQCALGAMIDQRRGAEQDRFEHGVIGSLALAANGAALIGICVTVIRRNRAQDLPEIE